MFLPKMLHYHKVGKKSDSRIFIFLYVRQFGKPKAKQNQSLKYYPSNLSWQLIRKGLMSIVYVLLVEYCTRTYILLVKYCLRVYMFPFNIHCLFEWLPNLATHWNHLGIFTNMIPTKTLDILVY